jgi:hypothetical protein
VRLIYVGIPATLWVQWQDDTNVGEIDATPCRRVGADDVCTDVTSPADAHTSRCP